MSTIVPDAFLEVDYDNCHGVGVDNLTCIRDQLTDCITLLNTLTSLDHRPLAEQGARLLHAFIMPARDAFLTAMQTECAKHGIKMELS